MNPTYEEDGYVEIAITTPDAAEESDGFYNGFATLTYDPEALTFQSLTPNEALTITSFTVDEEAGLIKFAYASVEPVAAGPVANVKFSAPEKGTIVTATTLEANDDLDVGEETEIRLGEGFKITIEDYTKGKAEYLGIDEQSLFSGEVTFTIESENDKAVLVAVRKTAEDEESFVVVPCKDDNGKHSFTITVEEDTTVALAFKGDADLDGVVKPTDGTMIKRAALKTYEFDSVLQVFVSDINGDGTLKPTEGTMVSRAAMNTYELPW